MDILVIDMGEANLVVEKYENKEFIVYFQDKKTNCITQDIITVRVAQNEKGETVPNAVDCLVWTDDSDENFTHEFHIKQFLEVV